MYSRTRDENRTNPLPVDLPGITLASAPIQRITLASAPIQKVYAETERTIEVA